MGACAAVVLWASTDANVGVPTGRLSAAVCAGVATAGAASADADPGRDERYVGDR